MRMVKVWGPAIKLHHQHGKMIVCSLFQACKEHLLLELLLFTKSIYLSKQLLQKLLPKKEKKKKKTSPLSTVDDLPWNKWWRVWNHSSLRLLSLIFFRLFLSPSMRTSCLIASLLFFCFWFLRCEGCLEEERNALLQLRDSFNYPNGFYLKDEWVGKNCCDWQMVTCEFNSSTYQVVEIYFYGYREDGQGKWYPNATLFTHFKGLRRLILDGNNIGGWIMPQGMFTLHFVFQSLIA